MKKFSIITICYNCESEIGDTIESVLNQTCTDYEYLIKDGMSQDNTARIAESYIPVFAQKGISYQVIYTKDRGIYDAMNQAVQEAQGEWFLFMNAGDLMADSDVLNVVKRSGLLEKADIVYGDTIAKWKEWYTYQKPAPLEEIKEKKPFCHQSAFAKGKLHKEHLYPIEYIINGDYLFYYQQYMDGKRFDYIPYAISISDRSGISSKNEVLVAQELLKIQEERPVRDEALIQKRKEILERRIRAAFIRDHFSKLIPEKLRTKRRNQIKKKEGWKHKEEFFEELVQLQGDGTFTE